MNRRFTGCRDKNGKKIHFGDVVGVTISPANPNLDVADTFVFGEVARKRTDGLRGFEVPFSNGCLRWDVDGEPCWDVVLESA